MSTKNKNVIYGLAGPDGQIRYVGFTTSTMQYRVNNHRSAAKGGHTAPVNQWIREVGLHSFTGVELEIVPEGEDLREKAEVWIKGFESRGVNLLNCTEAEHAARTRKAMEDPEVRAKISKADRSHTQTPEWRKMISEANKGRKISPEHRAIVSRTHKGKTVSEETRAKISERAMGHKRNLGRVQSAETREKMSVSKHNNLHVAKGIVKTGCRHCEAA